MLHIYDFLQLPHQDVLMGSAEVESWGPSTFRQSGNITLSSATSTIVTIDQLTSALVIPFRKALKTDVGKTPTPTSTMHCDHDYITNVPNRHKTQNKPSDDLNNLYKKTVSLLKDIKNTLDTQLAKTNDNINLVAQNLGIIAQELKNIRINVVPQSTDLT